MKESGTWEHVLNVKDTRWCHVSSFPAGVEPWRTITYQLCDINTMEDLLAWRGSLCL